jgi:DNA polymerase-4
VIARGHGSSEVTDTPWLARSRGRETTFQQDIADWAQVRREVARLARLVSGDVAAEQRPAVRVVVKIRYAPFITRTHGHSLASSTTDPALIEEAALTALDLFAPAQGSSGRPVRLLGVRAEFAG